MGAATYDKENPTTPEAEKPPVPAEAPKTEPTAAPVEPPKEEK